MINHEKEKLLGAFNLLQQHLFLLREAQKNEQADTQACTTSNILPPAIMNLIGVYLLLPGKLDHLLALVIFLQQDSALNTPEVTQINRTLNEAISTNNFTSEYVDPIYNTTFTRIIELIGNRKEALLREAAKAGNELAVMQLLKIVGIDVNAKDNDGTTALMWAANNGHTPVVTELLSVNDIEVNAKYHNASTALMMAAYNGHSSIVTALLNVDRTLVNAKSKLGITALMTAAYNGHTSVVTALLNVDGILVNAKNNNDWTALMYAAHYGHTSVVTQLLKAKDIEVNAKNNVGRTAVMTARYHGHSAIVSILLEAHKALFFNKAISTTGDIETLLKEQDAQGVTLTRDMMCDYLLKQVDAAPTNAEKTTLLRNALGNHAFGTLMRRTDYLGLGRSSTAVNRIEAAREWYTEPTYGTGRAIWMVTYTRSTAQHSNPIRAHHSIGF